MPKKIAALLYLLCSILCFPDLSYCHEQSEATVIEDKATLPLLDPAFSERKTLKITLKNGLQALVVSDPNVDKSSAALVVKTGSWEDPEDSSGIAHFLEHMLFLGTKKYPEEMGFDRFMGDHGGQFNAFTTNDYTSFVFTIDTSDFVEAIDRFSHFFKEPLFNPSGVDRELQAIDQEYAKNVENDDIRLYYILKELGNAKHPNHAFGMGNLNALSGVSQTTLKKWYEEHYSSNRMRLEVISTLPLEELKNLVIENFKDIPNKELSPIDIPLPLFDDSLNGYMIYIEPVKHLRRLVLLWELPARFAEMRDAKPEMLICHVLGQEGKLSLLDELKNEKLAEGIQCGAGRIGGKSYEMYLQIDLTDAGIKDVNKVILRIFEAIANMRQKELPDYLFEEFKRMTALNYQYQTNNDAFSNILKEAMILPEENMDTYPEQTLTIKSYDPKAVHDLLDYMTPAHSLIQLIAPKNLVNVSFDRKEHWLGASYAVKKIPEKTLELWNSAVPNPRIDLPAPNAYLPENTTVLSGLKAEKAEEGRYVPKPSLLLDDDRGKIYFAQDADYRAPTVNWIFDIKTPAIDPAKIETAILGDLYAKHAEEILAHYTFPASEAGLNFSVERSDDGIKLTVDGFSDKANELFQDLVNTLKESKSKEQKFRIYKELLQRQYQNMSLDSPLVQASELLRSVLLKDFSTSKAMAAAIKKITYDDFADFSQNIFAKTYVEGLVYGNISEKEGNALVRNFLTALDSAPYPKQEQWKKEVIDLPEDKGPFYLETKSKVQGNAAILTIDVDPFSLKNRAAQQLLMQAVKEPFFTALRTQQQTGYIVISQADELERHLFDTFSVQSNTHDSRDLLSRFELFLEGFIQEIDNGGVPKERFDSMKRALLSNLKKAPRNMSDMADLMYKLAFTYDGDFDWIVKRIDSVEKLSYEQFLDLAKENFGKNNKRRLAILFSGSVTDDGSLKYSRLCGSSQLRDQAVFSTGHPETVDE